MAFGRRSALNFRPLRNGRPVETELDMNRRNGIAFEAAKKSAFLALLFLFSGEALAQDQKPRGESSSTQHNGIKVHGHWTIEVRDPDGKLVTHHEFENALQPDGVLGLAEVLGRVQTVGFWAVQVFSATFGGPCLYNNAMFGCRMVESGDITENSPVDFPTVKGELRNNMDNCWEDHGRQRGEIV
jgi:hypothetical protein